MALDKRSVLYCYSLKFSHAKTTPGPIFCFNQRFSLRYGDRLFGCCDEMDGFGLVPEGSAAPGCSEFRIARQAAGIALTKRAIGAISGTRSQPVCKYEPAAAN